MISNFIVKTTWNCDLRCDYCYVTSPSALHVHDSGRISVSIVRKLFQRIAEYIHLKNETPSKLTFYWHGGEPLLAGKDFFRELVKLQDEILPRETTISNCIQTHGGLIDDEWADLFIDNNYSVTFSIDGNMHTHDCHRHDASGKGTYSKTLAGMNNMVKKGYSPCTLSVLTPEVVALKGEAYKSLRNIGVKWMDFLVPYDLEGNSISRKNTDDELASFWIEVFEEWMNEGNQNITVRYLKDVVTRCMGGVGQFCLSGDLCSSIVTVDKNGNIFACDDILHVQHNTKLGNLVQEPLIDIEKNRLLSSLTPRINLVSPMCLQCDVYDICKSGCPGKRGGVVDGRAMEQNIYCGMYKKIIPHIKSRVTSEIAPAFTAK